MSNDGFDHAEARTRDRVVGGLLVRRERDAVGKRGRHGAAMGEDMPRMALREPQLQRERERERGEEDDGERGGSQANPLR